MVQIVKERDTLLNESVHKIQTKVYEIHGELQRVKTDVNGMGL